MNNPIISNVKSAQTAQKNAALKQTSQTSKQKMQMKTNLAKNPAVSLNEM